MHESLLQSTCFQWHYNTYPAERGLLCYNLNNSANKIQGNQNRALGLIAGRSDMVYYKNGLARMLEFKTESGTQSPQQKAWESLMVANGFEYYVIRSVDQFKKLIEQWQN